MDGEHLKGKEAIKALIGDWELDLDAAESRSSYRGVTGRKPTKLVHNIVLSMPAARRQPAYCKRAVRLRGTVCFEASVCPDAAHR